MSCYDIEQLEKRKANLLKLKNDEPNNSYHDWDKEINEIEIKLEIAEAYQQGREDERKKILDILKNFTEGDYNSKECKLLVSDLREVLWEGEQNDK